MKYKKKYNILEYNFLGGANQKNESIIDEGKLSSIQDLAKEDKIDIPNISNISSLNDIINYVNENDSLNSINKDLQKSFGKISKKIESLTTGNSFNSRNKIKRLGNFVEKVNELESKDLPKIKEDLDKTNAEILKKIELLKKDNFINCENNKILSKYKAKIKNFIDILNETSDNDKEKEIKDKLNTIGLKINEKLVNIIDDLNVKIGKTSDLSESKGNMLKYINYLKSIENKNTSEIAYKMNDIKNSLNDELIKLKSTVIDKNFKLNELWNFKKKMIDMLDLFNKVDKKLNDEETKLKPLLDVINDTTIKEKLDIIKKQSQDNIYLIRYLKNIFYENTMKYIKVIRILFRLRNISVNKQRKFNNYIIIKERLKNGTKYNNKSIKSDLFYDNPNIEFYNEYILGQNN
tara:strand:+ start:1343 stop:2560 length:1218 start_codon:yes stop_codon:yes gene_type:complete